MEMEIPRNIYHRQEDWTAVAERGGEKWRVASVLIYA